MSAARIDPSCMSEEELLIRAREAAIECLNNSATMNPGASESARVAYRLGHRDGQRDSYIAAVRYFWRDIGLPIEMVRPEPSKELLLARQMAAEEARAGWPEEPERGEMEAQIWLSGTRDHFRDIKHRLEGLRARDTDTHPKGQDPVEGLGS